MSLTKDDYYFMEVAEASAKRSYCERKKVGAVLVRDNHIIATGRNGTLPGHDNCCEEHDASGNLVTNEFTLHAEQNILTFCNREGISTKDTTIYITLSPCKTCAKLMASAGIKKVFYKEEYRDCSGVDYLRDVGIDVYHFTESEDTNTIKQKKPVVIGLVGYAGSGKDTAYGIIKKRYPQFNNFKFAGKLKEFVTILFNLNPGDVEDRVKREMQQLFTFSREQYHIQEDRAFTAVGIDVFDVFDGDRLRYVLYKVLGIRYDHHNDAYFTRISIREILQLVGTEVFRDNVSEDFWVNFLDGSENVVVTDVRFPNEAKRVSDIGGYLIHINRPSDETRMSHASEAHIESIPCNYIINNNGGLDDFEKVIISVVNEIMERY